MKHSHWMVCCAIAASLVGAEERPVTLYQGLGAWTHPIGTRSAEAQKYFDQGLALNYGFNRYEALRSFRKAAELDPSSGMAYWGMAWAQAPYINMDGDPSVDIKGACAALEAGKKVAEGPARDWIQAAGASCPEYQPKAYTAAMRALAAKYPDDPDAQTLYAESLLIPVRWRWYDAHGKPAEGVEEAEQVLEEVMRRWPQHPGANHLYVHAVESSPTPERAIASAQRLMGIVPAAGHLVHMPGHIWLVLGNWQTAIDTNERAVAADRKYFVESGVVDGTYTPYYVHNLHFIVYASSMLGRRDRTVRAVEELRAALAPMQAAMPEMADQFGAVPILTLARVGAWNRIRALAEPGEKAPASSAALHYARALAFLAAGDRASAAQERERFEKQRKANPADAPWGSMNTAAAVLGVGSEILAARLATTSGEAVRHWRRAVEIQDGLNYDEPPDWYYPVRESLGGALLGAGNAKEAEMVFREGVKRSPHNGRMLFGLLESLKAQSSKQEEAEWVRREFEAVWKGSDIELRVEDL